MPPQCEPFIGAECPDFRSQRAANRLPPPRTTPSGPLVSVAAAAISQNQVQPRPSNQARKAKKAVAVTVKEKTPSVRARPNSLTPADVSMQAIAPKSPARTLKYFRPKIRIRVAVPKAARAPGRYRHAI